MVAPPNPNPPHEARRTPDPAPPPREPRITVTLADQRAATARAEAARERDPPGLGSPPPTPGVHPRRRGLCGSSHLPGDGPHLICKKNFVFIFPYPHFDVY